MTQDKLRGALSLCRRAGALVCGTEAVKDALRGGRVRLVLITQDAAQRTRRQMLFVCQNAGVRLKTLPASMEALSPVLGKPFGVMGLCDDDFCKLVEKFCLEGLDI